MSLPSEVRAKYVTIIDSILEKSDLNTISEKKIRQGLQDEVQYDITPQKAAIKTLIMERFDLFNARQNEVVQSVETVEPAPAPAPIANGHSASRSISQSRTPVKRDVGSDDSSDVADSGPPKKKRRASVEDDAAFAARLQAEEDRNARPTRGGNSRKTAQTKKKKTPKKKTSARVTGSDDSGVEDEEGSKRKVNRETGFHKPMNLSAVAAEFFGETRLSRPQVTKKVWDYIKSNQLQDQGDKRFIICDDKLRGLLKQDKVHMFTMTKILNTHMYNPED